MVGMMGKIGMFQKPLGMRLAAVAWAGLGWAGLVMGVPAVGAAQDLVIANESDLPESYLGADYTVLLHARGGTPSFHWHPKGALPPGLKLEDGGELHGRLERGGDYQFTVSVMDGSKPQQEVQKNFTLRVRTGLVVTWQDMARVNDNRIDGSVLVRNTTDDDIDLTYYVVALPPSKRAVAIGYQHFKMRRGMSQVLPFGDTLPHGDYTVRVDVIAEVAARKLILREHLETQGPLQVAVGP